MGAVCNMVESAEARRITAAEGGLELAVTQLPMSIKLEG